ncbi:MAG: hypothetical protein AB7E75_01360 [Candidatus Methanomethylophilaceae archaeon]
MSGGDVPRAGRKLRLALLFLLGVTVFASVAILMTCDEAGCEDKEVMSFIDSLSDCAH